MRVARGSSHLGPDRLVAGPDPHGAQLVQAEGPAALADALLGEDGGPTAEADEHAAQASSGSMRTPRASAGRRRTPAWRRARDGGASALARCANQAALISAGGHVAEDVLVEGGQLGVLEVQVQAAGRARRTRAAADAGARRRADRCARARWPRAGVRDRRRRDLPLPRPHVDAAQEPIEDMLARSMTSASRRAASPVPMNATRAGRGRAARRPVRPISSRRARSDQDEQPIRSAQPVERSMSQTTAAVAVAPATMNTGWMTRRTGRWEAGRCHRAAGQRPRMNTTNDTAPAEAAGVAEASRIVVAAAVRATRTVRAAPGTAAGLTPWRIVVHSSISPSPRAWGAPVADVRADLVAYTADDRGRAQGLHPLSLLRRGEMVTRSRAPVAKCGLDARGPPLLPSPQRRHVFGVELIRNRPQLMFLARIAEIRSSSSGPVTDGRATRWVAVGADLREGVARAAWRCARVPSGSGR